MTAVSITLAITKQIMNESKTTDNKLLSDT